MSGEDKNATADARKVLASFWVDLTQVNVRCTHGAIHISGYLRRMTYEHAEFDEKVVAMIDGELHGIDGVRNVFYELDNWKQTNIGLWQRVKPSTSGGMTTNPQNPSAKEIL